MISFKGKLTPITTSVFQDDESNLFFYGGNGNEKSYSMFLVKKNLIYPEDEKSKVRSSVLAAALILLPRKGLGVELMH